METPNGRVRWSLWSSGFGFVTQGQMQLCKVTEKLQKFEQAAKQLLAQTGANHVVYGRKIYDEDGKVKEVRFYTGAYDRQAVRTRRRAAEKSGDLCSA